MQVLIDERQWSFDGIRRKFADGKTQTIETLLNSILEGLAVCAAAIKAEREESERCKREREEDERRREEQRRIDALEGKRVEALTNYIKRRQHGQQILEFVSAVEEKLGAGDYEDRDTVQEWIDWAKDNAEREDPLSKGLPRLLQSDDFNMWELR